MNRAPLPGGSRPSPAAPHSALLRFTLRPPCTRLPPDPTPTPLPPGQAGEAKAAARGGGAGLGGDRPRHAAVRGRGRGARGARPGEGARRWASRARWCMGAPPGRHSCSLPHLGTGHPPAPAPPAPRSFDRVEQEVAALRALAQPELAAFFRVRRAPAVGSPAGGAACVHACMHVHAGRRPGRSAGVLMMHLAGDLTAHPPANTATPTSPTSTHFHPPPPTHPPTHCRSTCSSRPPGASCRCAWRARVAQHPRRQLQRARAQRLRLRAPEPAARRLSRRRQRRQRRRQRRRTWSASRMCGLGSGGSSCGARSSDLCSPVLSSGQLGCARGPRMHQEGGPCCRGPCCACCQPRHWSFVFPVALHLPTHPADACGRPGRQRHNSRAVPSGAGRQGRRRRLEAPGWADC